MAELTAADLQKIQADIDKYTSEADKLAKENGVDIKVSGNDAAGLLKASAAGMGTGAAVGAALGSVFPGIGTAIGTAIGAIAGAIAGFFAQFSFGPSPEAIALTKEFDRLNATIHQILLTVPQPYRDQLALLIINAMKKKQGPLPFCLEGGGCAMTSIEGVRNAASGLQDQIKVYLAEAQAREAARASILTPRRIGYAIVGLGGLYGLYYAYRRRMI